MTEWTIEGHLARVVKCWEQGLWTADEAVRELRKTLTEESEIREASFNGHNTLGHVWVVMPEEPSQIDNEPYVFNTDQAACDFARKHGGWISEEPILDQSFADETPTPGE